MPGLTITNQASAPASRYQSVRITVNTSELATDYLKNLPLGTLCVTLGGAIGFVGQVDRYGNSFEVVPAYDSNFYFYNSKKGVFLQDEELDIDFNP